MSATTYRRGKLWLLFAPGTIEGTVEIMLVSK